VSFGGPNPDEKDYIAMPDRDAAFRLRDMLLGYAAISAQAPADPEEQPKPLADMTDAEKVDEVGCRLLWWGPAVVIRTDDGERMTFTDTLGGAAIDKAIMRLREEQQTTSTPSNAASNVTTGKAP
jgi:hypothetical protein